MRERMIVQPSQERLRAVVYLSMSSSRLRTTRSKPGFSAMIMQGEDYIVRNDKVRCFGRRFKSLNYASNAANSSLRAFASAAPISMRFRI
jgi:hypothetical protein